MARTVKIEQSDIDEQRKTFAHQKPDNDLLAYWCIIEKLYQNLTTDNMNWYDKENRTILLVNVKNNKAYTSYSIPVFTDKIHPFAINIPNIPERIYAKNS